MTPIKFKIESNFTQTILEMFDSLRIFNTVTKISKQLEFGQGGPDSQIIRFGMGRATGHTQAASELCNRFVKDGYDVLYASDNYEKIKHAMNSNPVLHALVVSGQVLTLNVQADDGLRTFFATSRGMTARRIKKTIVIFDAVNPTNTRYMDETIHEIHSRALGAKTAAENYYIILQ